MLQGKHQLVFHHLLSGAVPVLALLYVICDQTFFSRCGQPVLPLECTQVTHTTQE